MSVDMDFIRRTVSSDVFRKTAETLTTRFFLIGIGLLTSVIVARILGPEGRGFYAVASAIAAFGVQFGNAGLHASNSYYVAKDRALLAPLLGNTVVSSLVVGGAIAAAALAFFHFRPGFAPLQGPLLPLAFAWIPFGLASLLLQNLLLGIRDVRAYNVLEMFNRVLSVALVAVLIVAGRVTVESVYLAGFSALFASILLTLRRLRAATDAFPSPSMPLFLENIRYGLKAYLAALFAYSVLRIDLLMIKYILGAAEAGYYSVAVSMADLVYLIPATVGTIIFPKLSAMGSDAERWEFTKKLSLYIGGALVVLLAVAIPLAPHVIGLLYGKAFLPAAPAFIVLGVGMIFYGTNNILSYCLAAMSFPWFGVGVWIVAAALNILLNLYLIPSMGILGASLSSLLCYFLLMASQYAYLARRGRVLARQA
ncbi:MAG: oligosaccharide flippase family protein [Deltaproteobacteria bacterium]|nr:oligosaccharide flippase family protein [Deltaproteobacteria bacterium]